MVGRVGSRRADGLWRRVRLCGPAAIFGEHAALSAFENNGTRDFDLGGLAGLSDADYDALVPLQWPAPVGGAGGTKRMFADGRFFTLSGRARFIAIEEPVLAEAAGRGLSFSFKHRAGARPMAHDDPHRPFAETR